MAGLDAAGIGQAINLAQGQAIKIIGGVPILKNLSGSTLEKLKLPKHLDMGNLGGILAKVMKDGPGAILQNPLAAVQGVVNGSIGNAVTQVTNALGSVAAPLTSALGNLQSSVGALSSLAGNLSGVTALPGLPNNFDLMGHIGLAQGFGDALPAGLGLDTVMAPLAMAGDLAAMAASVDDIGFRVGALAMQVSDGVAAVQAMQSAVDAATTNATSAIATLQAAGPAMMAAQAAVACLVPGTLPDAAASAMRATIRPDMVDTINALVSAHLDAIFAALPDPGGSDAAA